MAEFTTDLMASIRNLINAEMLNVNTSIEATIVSYADGKAQVRPIGKKRFIDGDELDFPVINNVPVRWPTFSGGNAGVKGPVTAGDKCLLVFSQQASDGTDDMRRFDLSDAYAVMVDGNSSTSQGGDNSSMVMYFGSAYIRITNAGKLEINAPGGTETVAPLNTYTGSSRLTGTFEVVEGDVIVEGISSKSHTHGGVQTGTGNTGLPQ